MTLIAHADRPRTPRRSPLRRMVRGAMFTMLALVGVYLAFAAFLWTQQPVISFDGVARIREMLPPVAREEDRAWPMYRAALVAAGLGSPAPGVAAIEPPFQKAPDASWAEWPQTRTWLQASAAQVATLREAAALGVLGVALGSPLGQEDAALFGQESIDQSNRQPAPDEVVFPVMNILLPHLASLRQAGQILSADMNAAVEDGDGARGAADFVALIRLASHAQEGRFLITDLVGISLRSLACQRLVAALEWKPEVFSDADLIAMQSAIAAIDPALQQMTLAAEAVFFEDVVQRLYSDNGNGDGWFCPSGAAMRQFQVLSAMGSDVPPKSLSEQAYEAATWLMAPVGAVAVAGRRDTMDFYNDWRGRAEAGSRLLLRDQINLDLVDDGMMTTRWTLPALLLPAVAKAGQSIASDRAVCEAVQVALACARYKLARGGWPASLQLLVPEYLAAVPLDTWSGEALLCAAGDAGFRVWSVGRNEVDDHGDPASWGGDESAAWRRSTHIGVQGASRTGPPLSDWIIFAPRGNADRWASQGG